MKYIKYDVQINNMGHICEGYDSKDITKEEYEKAKEKDIHYLGEDKKYANKYLKCYEEIDETIPDDLRDGREVIDSFYVKEE